MIINTGSRTDIPAFFSQWFLNRISEGFVCTRNPYNNDIYKIIKFLNLNVDYLEVNNQKIDEYLYEHYYILDTSKASNIIH